jgi:hypothetical protein
MHHLAITTGLAFFSMHAGAEHHKETKADSMCSRTGPTTMRDSPHTERVTLGKPGSAPLEQTG